MSEAEVVDLDLDLLRTMPLPHHPDDGDKQERGQLLVVGGSRELAGAALLAGIAALRAGAGKLQIATSASIAVPLSLAVPEARVIGLAETDAGCIAEGEIDRLIETMAGTQCVVLGCGLQHGAPLDALLDRLFARPLDMPLVLDAAVLGSLAERAAAVRSWREPVIILPHAGEMARLIECERDDIIADPLAAAQRAVKTFGTITLIKGEYSFVVAPDGRAFRYRGGGVGLATSGSGDTLAGIVGGLVARGTEPLVALLWGIYLHGEAGRMLTARVGRVGFLARELIDCVPGLMEQ